jgi:hypothetical protein
VPPQFASCKAKASIITEGWQIRKPGLGCMVQATSHVAKKHHVSFLSLPVNA